MAVKFKLARRGVSEHNYYPEEITVNEELNGRHELPDIEWLIESILTHGQLQPIVIRKEQDNPVLTAGFSRWRAVAAINERKLTEDPIPLRCSYTAMSEEQGFLANIEENRVRNQTTPIDDAYNIQRLINCYHKSEKEIAAIYRESTSWVRDRLNIIELTPEAQEAIASGRVKESAVKAIGKISKALQRKVAKTEGVITAKVVKEIAGTPAKSKKWKNDPELMRRINAVIESADWEDYDESNIDIYVAAEKLASLKNYILGE